MTVDEKLYELTHWIERYWTALRPAITHLTLKVNNLACDGNILSRVVGQPLDNGYTLVDCEPVPCDVAPTVALYSNGLMDNRSGGYCYRFTAPAQPTVEIMVVSAFAFDGYGIELVSTAAIPDNALPLWDVFEKACIAVWNARDPGDEVIILGSRRTGFKPTTDWDDIVLPPDLKTTIMNDVESFFVKGVEIYKNLSLKPFRKFLLAGVPGTGKTMICSALAKWAISRNYLVIYISSSLRGCGDDSGASFEKIEEALNMAANSAVPALVLIEEFDAYLDEKQRALVLNVLDGAEAALNDYGTLLVATTNYPEKIDERVMKRPGRLDRIFIIPETRNVTDAARLLQRYLGTHWQEAHQRLAQRLVGYPGAFVREVAIAALTQAAFADQATVELEVLEDCYRRLKEQIDARDDFLSRRVAVGFGSTSGDSNGGSNGGSPHDSSSN